MLNCWPYIFYLSKYNPDHVDILDKERYEKELRSLESHSDMLKKPKKCLSAYMIFVKETRPLIVDAHPEMGALQVMQQVGK